MNQNHIPASLHNLRRRTGWRVWLVLTCAAVGALFGTQRLHASLPTGPEWQDCNLSAPELAQLAAQLHHDPVEIYNWVRDTIRFEEYSGTRKGALATYFTGRGNDVDQAHLLTALLTLSDFQANRIFRKFDDGRVFSYVSLNVPAHFTTASPLPAGSSVWVPLAPWTTQISRSSGYDLFPCDTQGNVTIPAALDFRMGSALYKSYLNGFATNKNLTGLEFYEAALQSYLQSSTAQAEHKGKTLDDVRATTQLVKQTAPLLPLTLPLNYSATTYTDHGCTTATTLYTTNGMPNWQAIRQQVRVQLFKVISPTSAQLLLDRTEALSDLAGNRFTLEYNVSGTNSFTPKLVLYGTGTATTNTAALALTATDRLFPRFIFLCQGQTGADVPADPYAAPPANPADYMAARTRPDFKSGSLMVFNFDMLASSPKFVDKFKREVGAAAVPTESSSWQAKYDYLGKVGAVMSQSYFSRWIDDTYRASDLLHAIPVFPTEITPSSRTQYYSLQDLYVHPGTLKVNNFSSTAVSNLDPTGGRPPFGVAAQWNIDTMQAYSAVRKIFTTTAGETSSTSTTPLYDQITTLFMFGSSVNEAQIFEDWQRTPAISTVRGVMSMLNTTPTGVMVLSKVSGTSKYKYNQFNSTVTSTLTGTAGLHAKFLIQSGTNDGITEAQFGSLVAELEPAGATVITPCKKAIYTTTALVSGTSQAVSLKAFVYILQSPLAQGYMFTLDDSFVTNGGGSYDWATQAQGINYKDYYSSIETVTPYATTTYASQLSWNSPEARALVNPDANRVCAAWWPEGDPVNPVTGEFYLEEQPDLELAAPGGALGLTRQYRNQLAYNGAFGYGWVFNHSEYIMKMKYTPTANPPEYLRYYTADQTPMLVTRTSATSAFIYPAGATFRLEEIKTGTALTGYKVYEKDGGVLSFDAKGLLTSKADIHTNTTTFERDATHDDRVTAVVDRLGRRLEFAYTDTAYGFTGTVAKVQKAADFTGRACYYIYGGSASNLAVINSDTTVNATAKANLETALRRAVPDETVLDNIPARLGADNDLVAVVDVAGNVQVYRYLKNQDSALLNHNLDKCWLANGEALEIGYYKNDTAAYHFNDRGDTFHFQYSQLNHYAETWNEEGYYRKIFWDDSYNVTRVENETGALQRSEYDASHNCVKLTDGNGFITTSTYDNRRNLTKVLRPTGTWSYGYTYSSTTPSQFFRLVKTTETAAASSAKTVDFDSYGRPEWFTIPVANRYEQLAYDGYGNLAGKSVRSGSKTGALVPSAGFTRGYDADVPCLMTTETDGYGGVTTITYDGAGTNRVGRPLQIEYPENRAVRMTYNAYGQTVTRENWLARPGEPTGRWLLSSSVHYDTLRRPDLVVDALSGVTACAYHPARDLVDNARLASVTDPEGYTQTFEINIAGHVLAQTDRNGNTTRFTRNGMGAVTETLDALGNRTSREYDSNGNLTRVTSPLGFVTIAEYDFANRVKTRNTPVTATTWETTTYTFDAAGRPLQETAPGNIVTKRTYDGLGRAVTESRGVTTVRTATTTYDVLDRKIKEDQPLAKYYKAWLYDVPVTSGVGLELNLTSTRNCVSTYQVTSSANLVSRSAEEYDAAGRVSAVADANGNRTLFTYDTLDRKIRVADAAGAYTDYEYDDAGNCTAERAYGAQNQLLAETLRSFTLRGQLEAVYCNPLTGAPEAAWPSTVYLYDGNGNCIAETDQIGATVTRQYDALNRCIAVTDPGDNTSWTWYDADGRTTVRVDPLGAMTTSEYDAAGRILKQTDPAGVTVTRAYDAAGRLQDLTRLASSTALTCVTRTEYNDINEVTKVIDAYGVTGSAAVSYTYDALGRQTKFTRPDNLAGTTWVYTDSLRQATETDNSGAVIRTVFDLRGNPVYEVRRTGTTIAREFDTRNRLINLYTVTGVSTTVNKNTTLASLANKVLRQTFVYDDLGRLLSATDLTSTATHTVACAYDGLGRVVSETQSGRVVTCSFDDANRRFTRTLPGGPVLAVHHDVRGLPDGVTLDGGMPISFYHDAAGRPVQSFSLSPNLLHQYTHALNGFETGRLWFYPYDGNLNGHFLGWQVATPDSRGLAATGTLAFAVNGIQRTSTAVTDQRGRLTAEALGGSFTGTATWSPNLINTWTATNQNGYVETRTANADNEYTAVTGGAPTYDLEGNVTSWKGFTQAYDWANRLVGITGTGLTATFEYDVLNRRVAETVNGVRTEFLYDGNKLVAEYAAGQENPATLYVYNPATGEALLCGVRNAGGTYDWQQLLCDRLGSVIGAADAAGNLLEMRFYNPFGMLQAYAPNGVPRAAPQYGGRLGFTGRPHLYAAGLIDFHHRAYSPSLGAFLQRDPAGFADGVNRYAYCQNDPLNRIDPDGQTSRNSLSSSYRPASAEEADFMNLGRLAFDAHTAIAKADAVQAYNWGLIGGGARVQQTDFDFSKLLEVASCIPVVGTPASLYLAHQNFKEGNYGTATMYMIAAIPAFSLEAKAATTVARAASAETRGLSALMRAEAVTARTAFRTEAAQGFRTGATRYIAPKNVATGGVSLSEKGLTIVENHLATLGDHAPNAAMTARLRTAFANGEKVVGADANFYLHELSESTIMGRGVGYDEAHAAALEKYGVSNFSLYHPEVIQANPSLFNSNWFKYWGLTPPNP